MSRGSPKTKAAPKASQFLGWEEIELVNVPGAAASSSSPLQPAISRFPAARSRESATRRILAGGSMKARAAGAVRTHAQICQLLDPGLDVLAYGWGLVVAAMMEDVPRSIDVAAYVICEASARLAAAIASA